MELIGDVWVNWFEGEENGYNVCEFHEWRKHDFIELLDQVPLVKVETPLFLYIENDLADLPSSLLEEVRNKCYIRKNNQRQTKEYCFIATDGERHIVVDTLGYYIPVRKSRLIPRQEQLVLEKAETLPTNTYSFEPPKTKKEYHVLSPSPESMMGLTRRERQLKQLLMMVLDQMYTTSSLSELRYWYTEWFPKEYHDCQKFAFEEVWDKLFQAAQDGWSPKHATITHRMIKGQPYFEKIWELEHNTSMNEAGF